ncbi:universal stress protein [Companilactobacillus mishanensis]|uniref:Universal stress protein n=1 Tax=Companilactobacillus mishanensis TaxID=2486008 RepID=A0A5P0ZKR0_9LACO|nr:universal stress protein [Companilactobacillus mishanensis]MQS53565.1 universal stress protein [Companilactobacillus mishanensis]
MITKTFNNILVAVDDTADAQLAFDYAIHRAKNEDAKLNIVSILEINNINAYEILDKEFMEHKREHLEERILDYEKEAKDAGVKDVSGMTAEGDDEAGEIIVKKIIPDVDPDLLIVGSKTKQGLTRLLGSQASYMVRFSPVSVLVVR